MSEDTKIEARLYRYSEVASIVTELRNQLATAKEESHNHFAAWENAIEGWRTAEEQLAKAVSEQKYLQSENLRLQRIILRDGGDVVQLRQEVEILNSELATITERYNALAAQSLDASQQKVATVAVSEAERQNVELRAMLEKLLGHFDIGGFVYLKEAPMHVADGVLVNAYMAIDLREASDLLRTGEGREEHEKRERVVAAARSFSEIYPIISSDDMTFDGLFLPEQINGKSYSDEYDDVCQELCDALDALEGEVAE